MGCYDTLRYNCPHCGKRNEYQSKAWTCQLKTFTVENAPLAIVADFQASCQRGEESCANCGTLVACQVQRMVSITKADPGEAKDDDDGD